MGSSRKKTIKTRAGKSTDQQTANRLGKRVPIRGEGPVRAGPLNGQKKAEAKAAGKFLSPTEENYRSLFEHLPDGIYRTTPDGRILSANPALVRMFGYENEEEFKRKFRAEQLYLRPSDRKKYLQRLEAENEIHNFEIVLRRRDGSILIVLENVHVVREDEGKVAYYEGVLTDITERKRIENNLRESEAFSKAILENSPIGISVRSRTGQLLSANEAWKKIWAVSAAALEKEAAARQSTLRFDERDDYLLPHQDEVRRVYEQGGHLHLPELKTNCTRPGAAEWVAQHFYAIQDADGQVSRVVILTEDITERKRTETALREANRALQEALEREKTISRTDSLTGIFTRRHFFEITQHEFEAAKRYQRPLSVVMFDMDHLKQFNDTYGHLAGDELLKNVAHVAQRQLRRADVLARYGGDEFVILLSNSHAAEAFKVAERILGGVAAGSVEMNGVMLNTTVSLGIADYSPDIATVDQLVQRADEALYQAKRDGRNRVVAYKELKATSPPAEREQQATPGRRA